MRRPWPTGGCRAKNNLEKKPDVLLPEIYNSGNPSVIDKKLHFNIIMHLYSDNEKHIFNFSARQKQLRKKNRTSCFQKFIIPENPSVITKKLHFNIIMHLYSDNQKYIFIFFRKEYSPY